MILDKEIINRYNGLIFDMDGTVVDTMPCHARAWEMVGETLGYPLKGDVMYQLGGAPVRTIAAETMKKYGVPPDLLEQVIQLKRQYGAELIKQNAALLPAAKIVKAFFGKKPLALGTGSHRQMTDIILQKLNLQQYFNAVVTAEDVENHKPQPDTFLRCAKLIKVEPAQCLVFEDADLGIQAALAGGMHVFDVRVNELIKG